LVIRWLLVIIKCGFICPGLFSRAISESGSSLCPWTKQKKQTKRGFALENAQKLANSLDCPSSNKAFLVKCLQRIDAGKLLEQTISDDVLVSLLENWMDRTISELVD
jgi:carboxylesterase type B